MADTSLFRNGFGEVFSDRIVLYSHESGSDAPKGETFPIAAVEKINVQVVHARDAPAGFSGRWGRGRFALIGLGMVAAGLLVFGVWHFAVQVWPALAAAGKAVPIFGAALAGFAIGFLTYPYRVAIALHEGRAQSPSLGSLREARAYVMAARHALNTIPRSP